MNVLKIRDKDGNFIPILSLKGENGKSAYEQAKEGGYKGTEQEFIALLNGLTNTEDAAHYSDLNNPHKTTASQVGAIPEIYYLSSDLDNEIRQGGNKITVCCYNNETLNSPYDNGQTVYAHGMVITNACSNEYGTQMCMPSGESAIYVRRIDGNGVGAWVKMCDMNIIGGYNELLTDDIMPRLWDVENLTQGMLSRLTDAENNICSTSQTLELLTGKVANIATGSYVGTNTYGVSNPNTLTFDFIPLFVVVAKRGGTNASGGGVFIWINGGATLNFINNGSNYWCYPSVSGKTLSWYNAESAGYQLNSSSYDYDYLALGVKG
jgi:hypothetical protein